MPLDWIDVKKMLKQNEPSEEQDEDIQTSNKSKDKSIDDEYIGIEILSLFCCTIK
jgi:hypothetical protein